VISKPPIKQVARTAWAPGEDLSGPLQKVLIFAPTGNDGRMTAGFLTQHGWTTQVCTEMADLCAQAEQGCDMILLAEETLNAGSVHLLGEMLSRQPAWSDIPITIITSSGEASQDRLRRLASLGPSGNVGLLERPFRRGTLLSAVDVALRSRQRQYQIRNLLEEVKTNEARFRSMVDNIGQLAWMTDEKGKVVWLNRRWFEYTGVEEAAMLGWGWLTLCHPDHVAQVKEKMRECFALGANWEDTFPILNRRGDYHWFLTRAFPIRNDEGKVLRWFGTNTDITERKEAQATLEGLVQERTSQLTETNAQLETLVYSIAHDLRAPLRSMQAFAKMLLEDYAPQLDQTAENYAQRIVRSAETMDTLVLDLLAYGKVVRADIHLEAIDPEEAWQVAVSQHEQDIWDRKAIITTVPPFFPVLAHAATLSQILANLLGNALKFVDPKVVPVIRFSAKKIDDKVRLFVEDNGVGIAPEYHEKIFRVFERLENDGKGTGIGLSIVRKGIERMGGQVGLESGPDRAGALFWIELPGALPES
jgi:PAS domain S-box-containing protein